MKIHVRPIKQSEPIECTRACLRMVMEYYGYVYSKWEINNFIFSTDDGMNYNTEIARFAKSKGLEVFCYAYHLYITDPKDAELSKADLIKKLEDEVNHHWFDSNQYLLVKFTVQAIKDGVNYIIKKPPITDIENYLKNGIPLIASVNYAALHDIQGKPWEGHDIVLIGIENGNFIFIDPEHAKEESIDPHDLMFSIVARRAISTSAYLIAIIKPES